MEDQQSDSGDLTDDDERTGGSDDPDEPEDADRRTAEPGRAARLRRRTGGSVVAPALVATCALFIGAAAFAGAAVQPYLADQAVAAVKMKIARTATQAIMTLWNYTPETMDTLADRAAGYLSRDFEAEYRKFIDAIAPANKQAQITDTTQIAGVAVESLEGDEATVIVYTNTTASSGLKQSIPSLTYLTYRLTMRQQGSRWVITKMPTITSLDLRPRF